MWRLWSHLTGDEPELNRFETAATNQIIAQMVEQIAQKDKQLAGQAEQLTAQREQIASQTQQMQELRRHIEDRVQELTQVKEESPSQWQGGTTNGFMTPKPAHKDITALGDKVDRLESLIVQVRARAELVSWMRIL